jgi:hypothetical protein
MTQPPRDGGEHIADLLPAYLNGTLARREQERIRRHLGTCPACLQDLRAWTAVGAAAPLAFEPAAQPSPALLDRVWAELEATPMRASVVPPALRRAAAAVAPLARAQVRLIPRSIWIASALTMLGGVGLSLLVALGTRHASPAAGAAHAALILGIFAPLVAAIGAAYVYGPQSDAGLELVLATPTSPRLVLLTRLAIVVGYDLALSIGASLVLVVVSRGSFSAVVGVWIGPLLLLSSVSLVLSLLLSGVAAITGAVVLWVSRLVSAVGASTAGGWLQRVGEPLQAFWQSSPALVVAALALLAFAVFYVPRLERLPTAS